MRRATVVVFGLVLIALAEGAAAPAGGHAPEVEHAYRLIGKIRPLLFWIGADDVGGARIAWRRRGDVRTLALLIGSDPARAPREINEWGYVREEIRGDAATVFGIRTVTDGDSPDEADARRTRAGRLVPFGALCSQITTDDGDSWVTTVDAPRDATYRDFDRVLEAIERSVRWERRHTPRPPGVEPGFLTAIDALLRSTAQAAREGRPLSIASRAAYVYKDAVYDLSIRRLQRVGQLRTASATIRNLLRADFVVRNRATGWSTGFWVTYGLSGALSGIPVRAGYQPNWWFKVELELDERATPPPDPAADEATRQRIELIGARCTSQLGGQTPRR